MENFLYTYKINTFHPIHGLYFSAAIVYHTRGLSSACSTGRRTTARSSARQADGMEALSKIDALCPDIVIMDMNILIMNGLKVIQLSRIRSRNRCVIVSWLR